LPQDKQGEALDLSAAGTVVFRPDGREFNQQARGATCSSFLTNPRSFGARLFQETPFLGKKESRLGRERKLLSWVQEMDMWAKTCAEQCVQANQTMPALDKSFSEQTPPLARLRRHPELFGQTAPVTVGLECACCLINYDNRAVDRSANAPPMG